ncbi:MAG: H4MPT-linked C1 transfer pathway protein [Gammaproteobacteria bacterium]|nr:MAG: H4MPT-linked C1 transfer pathway protein [Gammaproteobacteria bacterium]
MSSLISGWDIGGAHIKVARSTAEGELLDIIQVACPLWLGIDQLERAIETIFSRLNNQHDITAITMTGELVDIFANRQAGVAGIIACLKQYINEDNIRIYGAEAGWLTPTQAEQQWQCVASRNWQASASLISQHCPAGLFVDIGSTTSDIIPFANNTIITQGYSDLHRQSSRQLLYTGAIRTPLIALTQTAPFNGSLVSLAAEVFATSADCWLLLNQLDPSSIQDNSADGKPWAPQDCASRIARLLGTDATEAELSQWQQLAQWFAEQQINQVTNAMLQVLSACNEIPTDAPIIGAGVGRFIVKLCAQRLNRPYQDFDNILSLNSTEASDHAPAVAVALLAKSKLP